MFDHDTPDEDADEAIIEDLDASAAKDEAVRGGAAPKPPVPTAECQTGTESCGITEGSFCHEVTLADKCT